jgi:hypothetical protein
MLLFIHLLPHPCMHQQAGRLLLLQSSSMFLDGRDAVLVVPLQKTPVGPQHEDGK